MVKLDALWRHAVVAMMPPAIRKGVKLVRMLLVQVE